MRSGVFDSASGTAYGSDGGFHTTHVPLQHGQGRGSSGGSKIRPLPSHTGHLWGTGWQDE